MSEGPGAEGGGGPGGSGGGPGEVASGPDREAVAGAGPDSRGHVAGGASGGRPAGHRLVNPESLAPAVGFSHVVVPAPGRTVYLGGQAGHRPDGAIIGEGLIEQFDQACANVVEALRAVGGRPEDLVAVQILVTDAAEYRAHRGVIGRIYQHHFGRHYPAMALVEVGGLFDPEAKVELVATAVIPEGDPDPGGEDDRAPDRWGGGG